MHRSEKKRRPASHVQPMSRPGWRALTLAEVLQARGFRTGGFVGAYVLDSKWGINQGFDTYFDDFDLSKYKAISLGAIQRPGNEVVDHALQWLGQDAAKPFFCWMH